MEPFKIVVDSGAAHDALRFREEPSCFDRMPDRLERTEDATAFWLLYEQPAAQLCYNSMLDHHMITRFGKQWIHVRERFTKCSVPRSRADRLYKADGSLKAGGQYGGSLRSLLPADHEVRLLDASTVSEAAYKEERRKEHDYEHLESALELAADYFITTDYALLRRLIHLTPAQRGRPEIQTAQKIAVRPSRVLELICPRGR